MRKKKSEMTPVELVDQALKGRSWDEAETAGIEILARCMALHVYARNENDYVEKLFRRICERSDQWGDVPNHITFRNPQLAYHSLIDRICGKGTWDSNPFVFVYEFELSRKDFPDI